MKKNKLVFLALTFLSAAGFAQTQERAYPAPEKGEMSLGEITKQSENLYGKVVRVWINKTSELKQFTDGTYAADCSFYNEGQLLGSQRVLFYEKDGCSFFNNLLSTSVSNSSRGHPFFLFFKNEGCIALGNQYDADRGEYRWTRLSRDDDKLIAARRLSYKAKKVRSSRTSLISQKTKKPDGLNEAIDKGVEIAKESPLPVYNTLPKPEEGEHTFLDVTGQQYTLKDKVVRVRVYKVSRLEEIDKGVYSIYCQFKTGTDPIYRISAEKVYFQGKSAYAFFKNLIDPLSAELYPSYGVPIYILVNPGNLSAVGNRYDQHDEEYSWSKLSIQFPEPERGSRSIQELNGAKFSLNGKVVRVEANNFHSLYQILENEYNIHCISDVNGDYQYCTVYFSGIDAYDFFKDLTDVRTKRDFYVYVFGEKYYAIGRRYDKRKGVYKW